MQKRVSGFQLPVFCCKIWGGQGHSRQAIKLEADRNSFSPSAPKVGYLVIFVFLRFRSKINLIFVLFFVFIPKCHFHCRKCYVRNWTVTIRSVIQAQLTFVFVFLQRKEFHFRRHFGLRPKMKNKKMHFRSASASNCFGLHPTSMIFKHSTITVRDSL